MKESDKNLIEGYQLFFLSESYNSPFLVNGGGFPISHHLTINHRINNE